ncbi:hypothetical protein [Bacillus phage vB_BanS-Thrax3]|nr:hypothetical protein [Bacillus phage vB_BanS-Thrax3]
MKNLAHRKAYLTFEDLKKAFGIPDEIDIVAVKDTSMENLHGDLEFLLVSKEPVDGITVKYEGDGILRRMNLNAVNQLIEDLVGEDE